MIDGTLQTIDGRPALRFERYAFELTEHGDGCLLAFTRRMIASMAFRDLKLEDDDAGRPRLQP